MKLIKLFGALVGLLVCIAGFASPSIWSVVGGSDWLHTVKVHSNASRPHTVPVQCTFRIGHWRHNHCDIDFGNSERFQMYDQERLYLNGRALTTQLGKGFTCMQNTFFDYDNNMVQEVDFKIGLHHGYYISTTPRSSEITVNRR